MYAQKHELSLRIHIFLFPVCVIVDFIGLLKKFNKLMFEGE